MSLIDLQMRLLTERMMELATRKRIQRQRVVATSRAEKATHRRRRAKKAFALRVVRRLTFKQLGQALNVSIGNARKWFETGCAYYTQRKHVPAFHDLKGDNWAAYNCSRERNWFGPCNRPNGHPKVVSRVVDGKVWL